MAFDLRGAYKLDVGTEHFTDCHDSVLRKTVSSECNFLFATVTS